MKIRALAALLLAALAATACSGSVTAPEVPATGAAYSEGATDGPAMGSGNRAP